MGINAKNRIRIPKSIAIILKQKNWHKLKAHIGRVVETALPNFKIKQGDSEWKVEAPPF